MHRKNVCTRFNPLMTPLASFAMAAFFGALLASAPALSQTMQTQANDTAKITVDATGTASQKPDMALINLSVTSEGSTARQAMSKTAETMKAVIRAAKETGVEDKDMQTVGLTVQPLYQPEESTSRKATREKQFQAVSVLALKIRDLGKLGQVVDNAVSSGANGIGQMTLTNADLKPLYNAARKNAVANAMEKARIYAEAAGMTLGPVWRMAETSADAAPMRRLAVMSASAAQTPIAAGENSYDVTISLTMELMGKK